MDRPDRVEVARLIYQYASLIDDRDIVKAWIKLPQKERWLDGADQIIALIPNRDKIKRVDYTVKLAVHLMEVFSNASADEWDRITPEARQAWLTDAYNIQNLLLQTLKGDRIWHMN